MKIETTIYVNRRITQRLDFASKELRKSRSYVIRLLLGKLLEDKKRPYRHWSRIKYQERDLPANWSTFHLILREDEYEYSQDLRKVYKMSLSHVIAYAVKKYLDGIISLFSNSEHIINTDNHLYKNYLISYSKVNGIHCWKYYWGYPAPDIISGPEGSL